MRRCAGVLLLGFLQYLAPATASPVTYACQLSKVQAPEPDTLQQVDQVVIDDEADMLDLRVARTVGTQNFTNWIYATRDDDKFMVRRLDDGDIVGAGMRADVPTSFVLLPDGRLRLAYISGPLGVRWFEWKCER